MRPTILLADDSVTIQRVIELTFAEEGFRVVSAGDGEGALEAIERERPDIVLVDASLPGRDGYELLRHVKSTPHLARIPVVLLAGAFEPIDEHRARAAGSNGVLVKPFEPKVAVDLVRRLLSEAAGTGPGAGEPPEGIDRGYPFEAAPPSPPAPSLDEYFDRLDEALAGAAHAEGRSPREPGPATPGVADAGPELHAPHAEVPTMSQPEAASAASGPRPEGTLADTFSALLAYEQGEGPPPPPANAVAVTDELVDELTRRVALRLTDSAIRELVSAHVLEVAERLVLQEIEKIRTTTGA